MNIDIQQLQADGFLLIKKALSPTEIKRLIECTTPLLSQQTPHGVRNLFSILPCVKDFIQSSIIKQIIGTLFESNAQAVRSIFFDKIPEANWNVAWHQDTTIAVDSKCTTDEMSGYTNWTEKSGVAHVQPPVEVMENMLTLRLHLDRADEENGVLRVIPGSHTQGRISSANIIEQVTKTEPTECLAEAGDILLMKPLLFHSSRKSRNPTHRRIIHIEYSSYPLPSPLAWNELELK